MNCVQCKQETENVGGLCDGCLETVKSQMEPAPAGNGRRTAGGVTRPQFSTQHTPAPQTEREDY